MADLVTHHFDRSSIAPTGRTVKTQAGSGSHN
jgi:hypothetical protein